MKRTLTISIILILSLGLLLILTVQSARTPTHFQAEMENAAQLYAEGNYAQAAAAYEALFSEGIHEPSLNYNLGNAYYKNGDLGLAILNYKRAERLSPRDQEIQQNLNFVRESTIDQINTSEENFFSSLLTLSQSWLTLNELAVIALVCWSALALIWIARSGAKRSRGREALLYSLLFCAFLLLLSSLSLGGRLWLEHERPAAVILSEEADVMSGPGEQFISEFTLHEGAEVNIIEQRASWSRISLPGDLDGWVPGENIQWVLEH